MAENWEMYAVCIPYSGLVVALLLRPLQEILID